MVRARARLVAALITAAAVLPITYAAGSGCREASLVPLGKDLGTAGEVSGSICYAEAYRSPWPILVKLTRLAPEKTYWLTLNCTIPGSEECRILGELAVPGWPPGKHYNGEGYWDFEQVQTDSKGAFDGAFELPLPSAEYRVKFFVKRARDWAILLHNDNIVFEVNQPPPGPVTYIVVAAAAFACFAAFYFRKRKVGQGSGPQPEEFTHSPDYRLVVIRGQRFQLSPQQAHVIELLHKHYLAGTPGVEITLLREQCPLSPDARLKQDVFRRNLDAYEALIQSVGRGTVRLNLSSAPPTR